MARKQYSARFKFTIVNEIITGQSTVAQAAKARNVHPNSIQKWVNEYHQRGAEIFERKSAENDDKKKIAQLERMIGKKEVEIALLKNFLGTLD